MRSMSHDVCGCFPTGRHYPGIADLITQQVADVHGLAREFAAADAWYDIPVAVIDFETTGFDEQHDRVVEVGVVCFQRGEMTKRENWLVQPGMPIPEQAISVHGITDEMVADAPRFEEIAAEVLGVLKGHLPVAYNAHFDRKFLHAELARAGKRATAPAAQRDVEWIDPLVWVRELQSEEKSKKLGDVCERMGIELNDAHRAWADAEATGKVLNGLASQLPKSYGELIRIQTQYAAHQEAEMSIWKNRRG